jgi:hypothetical protein
MTELVLAYVGTILIAFEFIRKFKDLQAFVALLFGWPFRQFINAMYAGRKSTRGQKVKEPSLILVVVYALLIPVMLLLTIVFYLINLVVAIPEEFHNLVNRFYLSAKKEYRPTYGFVTRMTLRSSERYKSITEKQAIDEIQKREIPVLPIAGVILITIALFMQIL